MRETPLPRPDNHDRRLLCTRPVFSKSTDRCHRLGHLGPSVSDERSLDTLNRSSIEAWVSSCAHGTLRDIIRQDDMPPDYMTHVLVPKLPVAGVTSNVAGEVRFLTTFEERAVTVSSRDRRQRSHH